MTQTLTADEAAAEAIRGHHAAMNEQLERLSAAIVDAARAGRDTNPGREALLGWLDHDLLPHAMAEETTLYQAAAEREWGRALVEGMLREHRAILAAVDAVREASDDVEAAATSHAVGVLFAVHLEKENELIVPPLVADPSVALAELLDGMHHLLGGEDHEDHEEHEAGQPEAAGECGCGQCGCGDGGSDDPAATSDPGLGNLRLDDRIDVRSMPPAERHATIFGRLAALRRKEAVIIVNDHDPLPLRYQLDAEQPGAFEWSYLQRGPQTWQVRVERVGAV